MHDLGEMWLRQKKFYKLEVRGMLGSYNTKLTKHYRLITIEYALLFAIFVVGYEN